MKNKIDEKREVNLPKDTLNPSPVAKNKEHPVSGMCGSDIDVADFEKWQKEVWDEVKELPAEQQWMVVGFIGCQKHYCSKDIGRRRSGHNRRILLDVGDNCRICEFHTGTVLGSGERIHVCRAFGKILEFGIEDRLGELDMVMRCDECKKAEFGKRNQN